MGKNLHKIVYSSMIDLQKEFVPYEEALALKEIEFDEPCFGYFNTTSYLGIGSFVFKECDKNTIDDYGNKPLLRPTFSQAFRFFRENHNLHYFIDVSDGIWFFDRWSFDGYKTYEEAELASLRKLIEIVKNCNESNNI